MSTLPYHLAQTLLKIENVCLSASADGRRLLMKEESGSRPILKNVNAEIKDIEVDVAGTVKGQVVGFLGPSGIGKTQLFRIIAGLNQPTSGSVYINCCNCGRPDCTKESCKVRAGDVGVVAQSYPLLWHRTVMSNMMIAARQKEKDEKVAKDKVLALLEEFGLTQTALLYPAQLSGGQRQRCAIIQQILCSEHFLLMDEPFSGLDLIMLEKTSHLISEIANRDSLNTVIVVTHDVTAACAVADHIWLMGRDRDAAGNIIPGSRIVKEHNLIDADLAWQPDIITRPQFMQFVGMVKEEFRYL